jgi:hypothetical protein
MSSEQSEGRSDPCLRRCPPTPLPPDRATGLSDGQKGGWTSTRTAALNPLFGRFAAADRIRYPDVLASVPAFSQGQHD